MIARRMPPLNALRAFEATGRHLSITHAADELCVTPGAVSQLVKALEQHLGTTLFHRRNRGLALTDAGQSYLPAVRNAFRQIAEATARIASVAETGILAVSAPPFFASAWLVPRLEDFRSAHPEIDVQIMASKGMADFARDNVDVAIRHGLGLDPGLYSERLLAVELVPVATPGLVNRLGRPREIAALTRWPLVHDVERKDWHLWFRTQGIHDIGAPRGPSFDDFGLMLKAVLADQGAGLLPAAIIGLDLAEGRLVRLADVAWPASYAYYLAYPDASRRRPKVAAFRDWILAAASASSAASEAHAGANAPAI
jgi:LysR family glycine cleavage system transcriptional activator